MALSVEQLAVELRVITEENDEIPAGQRRIIARLLATSAKVVELRAPTAPVALADSAVVALAAYIYDKPGTTVGAGYANAFLNSGASSIPESVCNSPGQLD